LGWTRGARAGPDDPAAQVSGTPAAPESAPEITVRGHRSASAEGFSGAEARQLPGALGDPLRAVEALPGVTPTLSGVPYFFVRGAPPGDVGYFFDGVRLPALFHALGGPSVVHPGLVDQVQLYPGPSPVEYGRLAGGVVVARATEPAFEPRGEIAIRATDSSALLDTPLGPDASLALAGRYSYANPILHLFSSDLSVSYWDYQARANDRLSRRDQVTLLAFGAHDALTDHNDGKRRILYGIDFERIRLRFEHRFERGSLGLYVLGGWNRTFAEGGDVRVDDLSSELGLAWAHELTRQISLRAGANLNHDRYGLDATKLDDRVASQRYAEQFPARVDSTGGVYVACDAALGSAITLTPGLRVDAYSSQQKQALAVDPRISAAYRVSSRFTLHSAFGIAHQPPASSLPMPGFNPTLGQGLQSGVAESFGLELRLPSEVTLAVTLFQNAIFNLSDGFGQARVTDADPTITEDTRGTGRSRGLELLVRRSLTRRLGGFLSYTLSGSWRSVGRAEVPSAFDRRHVLGGALGYEWGRGYRSGIRGTFYTGVPADVAYLEAARDPPRTSPFYRIDLRSEKRFRWGDNGYISVVFEIVNATLEREVLRASCDAYVCKQQRVGPVTIPNLGIEAGF
jgi:hypothetical protein